MSQLYSYIEPRSGFPAQKFINKMFNFIPGDGPARCVLHEIPRCQACTTVATDQWEVSKEKDRPWLERADVPADGCNCSACTAARSANTRRDTEAAFAVRDLIADAIIDYEQKFPGRRVQVNHHRALDNSARAQPGQLSLSVTDENGNTWSTTQRSLKD